MKTTANSVNNRIVMTVAPTPTGETLEEQYGEGYFTRVYRTSLIAFVVTALLVGGRLGMPGMIGLSYGAAISLGGLRALELVVPALFRPGVRWNPRWVVALTLLKLPLLSVILAGAAWLVVQGYANPFTLVGGLALTQAVMFLKAVGSLLVSALPDGAPQAPAPWMNADCWRLRAAYGARARAAGRYSRAGGRSDGRPRSSLSPSGLSTLN